MQPLALPWPSLGLLALGIVAGLIALNAHRPFRPKNIVGTAVVFFVGWLTGELAIHHVFVQTVAAIALVYHGALGHVAGGLGLAIAIGAWGSLLRFHADGHRALERTSLALAESPNVNGGDHAPARIRVRDVARPFSMRHSDVTRKRRLAVHRGEGYTLRADVYHRTDVPSGAPVFVYVHGGAWTIGFKRYQGLPLLYRLARAGWVCVSIDHRLSPRATFPDHAIDVMRGIAWAKEHAHEFGGDPRFVALCGNSSGAHLAALTALASEAEAFKPGFESTDTRVDACVGLYGVYDLTDRHGHWRARGHTMFVEHLVVKQKLAKAPDVFRLGSPIDHIRPDAPPFFLVHGDCDTLVPVEESRRFADALRATSTNPVVYAEIEGAQHAFDIFHSVRGRYAIEAVVSFLESARRSRASA